MTELKWEVLEVNIQPDIKPLLERQLVTITTSGWTSYTRPARGDHPSMQVREKNKFEVVLLDLGSLGTERPASELLRTAIMPSWFIRDIFDRTGPHCLIVVLTPAKLLQVVSVLCRRLGDRERTIFPIPREQSYWMEQELDLSSEIVALVASRDAYASNVKKFFRFFEPPGVSQP